MIFLAFTITFSFFPNNSFMQCIHPLLCFVYCPEKKNVYFLSPLVILCFLFTVFCFLFSSSKIFIRSFVFFHCYSFPFILDHSRSFIFFSILSLYYFLYLPFTLSFNNLFSPTSFLSSFFLKSFSLTFFSLLFFFRSKS